MKNKPGICPECGSENVVFGDVEFQTETNYQDCGCNECGCRWNEIYGFSKKEIIKRGIKTDCSSACAFGSSFQLPAQALLCLNNPGKERKKMLLEELSKIAAQSGNCRLVIS